MITFLLILVAVLWCFGVVLVREVVLHDGHKPPTRDDYKTMILLWWLVPVILFCDILVERYERRRNAL